TPITIGCEKSGNTLRSPKPQKPNSCSLHCRYSGRKNCRRLWDLTSLKEVSVHSPLVEKNWVFSGSPAGAEASAAAYSLIETCIANKVDTKEYLEYIFTNMSQEESLKDDAVLEKYLPWNVSLPTE
ncbi:hypothetical protein SAMN02745671_02220, partial [Anaerovibrio lipolyticus DSM 3074]